VKFVATKKGLTTNFFSPLSFVAVFGSGIRDPGSGMGKNQDPGSGINIRNTGKNFVWFGEIERKLTKLSMTNFTYRSSTLLFYDLQ
jgi:hypothetical protein